MSVPFSKILDHNGLVVGFCHDLGFAAIIAKALGGDAPERKNRYLKNRAYRGLAHDLLLDGIRRLVASNLKETCRTRQDLPKYKV